MTQHAIEIEEFEAELTVPDSPRGVVLLINGDRRESARRRSNSISDYFAARRYASCILDLSPRRGIALVSGEERDEISILVDRVTAATSAIRGERDLKGLRIGHFASGVGSAASMTVAASDPHAVQSIVSTDGRPDLADVRLHRVSAPSLFLVTGGNRELWELNRWAQWRVSCATRLEQIQGPAHDIPPGMGLGDLVARATRWFDIHLVRTPPASSNRSVRTSPFRRRWNTGAEATFPSPNA